MTSQQTPISVVIPTYNRADLILEAVESVLAQTYPVLETIVVDDGSTDDTRQRLATWVKQGKLRYIHQAKVGVSAARNRGVQEAKGELIAFLDSDDLFVPDKLEQQMAVFARDPDLGFVHCGFSKFDEHGQDLGYRDTSRYQGWIYPWMLLEWSTLMAMPCMLVRKDVFNEVGGFDEGMTWAEDLDLWRRIGQRYRVGVVPRSLVKVRVHSTSTTFSKAASVDGFHRYLEKAFADDPKLDTAFRNQAYARMYTNVARNLLGAGGRGEMQLARRHSLSALKHRPLFLPAIASWLASWLPGKLRARLVAALRAVRYRPASG